MCDGERRRKRKAAVGRTEREEVAFLSASKHVHMYACTHTHSVHHEATLVERSLVKKTSEMIFPRPSPAAPASSGLTMWYSWSFSSWRKSGLMAVALLLAIMVPMVSTEWGGEVGGACITFIALQYHCIAYNECFSTIYSTVHIAYSIYIGAHTTWYVC